MVAREAYSSPPRPEPPQRPASPRRFSATRTQVAFGLVLLLALALRVVYVLHTSNFAPREDGHSYDSLARGLVNGRGWIYGKSAYRPPGYPFFLAGIYELVGTPYTHNHVGGYTAVRLVEAVLSTATVALIGILAKEVAGRAVAFASMVIAALYLPLILVGVSIMTESLLVPLILGAAICALRSRHSAHRTRWIVAAGVLAGLSALTRGNGVAVAPALACVVWTGRPRFRPRSLGAPVLLLVVTALTISPWTIRNAIAQHHFIPVTTELGATLAGTYNNVAARHHFIWEAGFQYSQYRSLRNDHKLSEWARSSRLQAAVFSYIGKHPLYVPEAMFWNTVRLADLEGRRISRTTARTDVGATAGVADAGVYVFWLVGLLAIGALLARTARRVPKSLWLVPFLIWLSEAPITTGTPRFRAALDPWIILLAATALAALARVLSRKGFLSRKLEASGYARAGAAP